MMTRPTLPLLIALALNSAAAYVPAYAAESKPLPLTTVSERSGFQQTGRYDEVIQLCNTFQKTYPKAVRCVEFGRTPEGRPMLALIASRSGALTAAEAGKRKLPVVLIQGGIHAGEIDGKDAGFLALREILDNKAAKGALDKQVLVFVPVFNIDGHERFGRWNRPNQRGPEEMGWRTTGQNLNLNRDYAKADAPEMQAMLRLINDWDPVAEVDLHVTDGAKFEHDISIQVEPTHAGDEGMQKAGRDLQGAAIEDLAKQGSLPLPYYMSFKVDDDPMSGFADSVSPPRFSTGYFQLRNRLGMLVETHSWKDYPTRVRITHNTIVSVLQQMAQHGAEWRLQARQADQRAEKLGGQDVPLSYKVTDKTVDVAFRGYAYTRTQSDISGALMTRYDETKPQIWNVKLQNELVPDISVKAPQGGYLVAAAYAPAVAEKLKQHGVQYRVLSASFSAAGTETFRADKAVFDKATLEGRHMLSLQGSWKPEQAGAGKGSLFVPIAQPKSRLVMALLEPRAPDALVAWGYFNNAFEKKEYMEAYVAEEVAREQLAANPALKTEFEQKLASDADFAKNPWARLEFFARRHSSWDQRYMLYPVMRTAVVPQ
ncbi:M14 family metallopeptidase [Undibacterium terreum]|uniref:Peptidase M14 domain-containing protein n=1 Tax=Undibacterium terreum TaxID=1224302 RepID=A0A916UT45_9BURK|nr:hypothetical protein GCM10011396_36220 [Undibacterium terreum]